MPVPRAALAVTAAVRTAVTVLLGPAALAVLVPAVGVVALVLAGTCPMWPGRRDGGERWHWHWQMGERCRNTCSKRAAAARTGMFAAS